MTTKLRDKLRHELPSVIVPVLFSSILLVVIKSAHYFILIYFCFGCLFRIPENFVDEVMNSVFKQR